MHKLLFELFHRIMKKPKHLKLECKEGRFSNLFNKFSDLNDFPNLKVTESTHSRFLYNISNSF